LLEKIEREREREGGRDSTIWLTAVISHPQHDLRELPCFTAVSAPATDLGATPHDSSEFVCLHNTRTNNTALPQIRGFRCWLLNKKPWIQTPMTPRQIYVVPSCMCPSFFRFPLMITIPPLHLTHQSRTLSREFTLTWQQLCLRLGASTLTWHLAGCVVWKWL
jgi:hypothetical protein